MSHAPWFHVPELPEVGATLTLSVREARHAAGSNRLRPGDELTLFDGHGAVGVAELTNVDGTKHVELKITDRAMHERPQPTLWLASALPKGDRQSIMLNMAAQLGMARFTALECEHSVALATGPFWKRSERIVLEACKQSRQPYLPTIKAPREPGRFASDAVKEGWTVLIADPSGAKPSSIEVSGNLLAAMVGPEGGFTNEERAAAVAGGAQPVSLGSGILRIETAAVALAAYLRLAVG